MYYFNVRFFQYIDNYFSIFKNYEKDYLKKRIYFKQL